MEHAKERDRVERILARAVEQGAKVVFGGGRPHNLPEENRDGFFLEPTVLLDVTSDMEIMHAEIFEPVAPLCRVSSFDEALELTNASGLGLGANVYTKDAVEMRRAAIEIVAGMVWVNAPLLDNDAGPFGGRKMSGIGRQLGSEGLDTFRHTKTVMIDPAAQDQDFWWFPYSDDESWSYQ